MTWLREQLRSGIFGESLRSAIVTLILGAATIVVSLFYDALNHGPSVRFLRTPLDDLIPVVGPFAVPYVSLRPFICLSAVLFLLFRVRIYRSAAVSMIVVLLTSYAFYALAQTYIDRPAIVGDDLFSRLIRDIYASDQPYNDFPSLHASLSTIFAIHWLRADRHVGLPIAFWAALIVVSTVFVKQHYVPDVVAGVLLASVTSWWSLRRLAGPASA